MSGGANVQCFNMLSRKECIQFNQSALFCLFILDPQPLDTRKRDNQIHSAAFDLLTGDQLLDGVLCV